MGIRFYMGSKVTPCGSSWNGLRYYRVEDTGVMLLLPDADTQGTPTIAPRDDETHYETTPFFNARA
jgi:hypothetical protein